MLDLVRDDDSSIEVLKLFELVFCDTVCSKCQVVGKFRRLWNAVLSIIWAIWVRIFASSTAVSIGRLPMCTTRYVSFSSTSLDALVSRRGQS